MADTATIPLPFERRWSLAAAIASVAVFGLGIGQAAPLMSLLLDAHGTNPAINGLNAAAAFVGVLIGPLLTPRGVRAFGIRNFLLLCFVGDVAVMLSLKRFETIGAWFVLRACSGLLGSSIFTASEAWINLLAGGAGRGRIIGLYVAALSAGFGIGPMLLSLTGIGGWAPFLANAAIVAVAALPLLRVGNAARDLGREQAAHPLAMFARAPLIMLAVVLFGLYESTAMVLLPIWGVRLGFSPTLAATTLSALYFGSVAMQVPLGWLSDKTARLAMLRLCGGVGLIGAVGIGALAVPSVAILPAIAVWGGIATGIYPVALSLAGDRFRGSELVAANAAIIIAYGLGGLVGPGLGGATMALAGPRGLFVFFAVLFCLFLAATAMARNDSDRR
ncbi:MAG TPA: MFS transporter [Acetobacteraceae bacterium]|nr:MFS transporter [Acetobacteraceae bacterium]